MHIHALRAQKYDREQTVTLLAMLHGIRNSLVGNLTVLLLLDLTAAFDTIDHILMKIVGIRGNALNWIKSHFPKICFSVHMGEPQHHYHGSHSTPSCGIPQ